MGWWCYMVTKLPCFIFDMDKTLADNSHREPWTGSATEAEVMADVPMRAPVWLARAVALYGTLIVISAREEQWRAASTNWLNSHGIFPHRFYMRADKDSRPDNVVKREVYEQHIKGVY